jgi:hypothetical protein
MRRNVLARAAVAIAHAAVPRNSTARSIGQPRTKNLWQKEKK